MVWGFLGNAVAWVLAVWFVAVGVWLFWIGSRICAGFMNPSRDILAWYSENRNWTVFHALNWTIPGMWGLPYGLMVAGIALTLYDVSWMMNKSGLAALLSGGELLNLLSWASMANLIILGLLVAICPLGVVMAIKAGRKGFLETSLGGVAGVLGAAWFLYFCFFDAGSEKYFDDSGAMAMFGNSFWFHLTERAPELVEFLAGQDGLKGFLVGALAAGAIGVGAFLFMAGLSMLTAVFNGLLVALFTFHPVTFSFGAVGLGAFAVLAFNSAG